MNEGTITSVMHEGRVFKPAAKFSKKAHVKSLKEYKALYEESIRDPEGFWDRQAKQELIWSKPWKKVLEWKEPYAKWFIGGKLNASYNCLDRHIGTPVADKPAIIWEGEPLLPGDKAETRTITYKELHKQVGVFAGVLARNGVKKGDRVLIYLPMVPEAAVAMLACARIGAVHSVVFGGFSARSVADRIEDMGAKLVITADGGFRRGSVVQLKNNVDEALDLKVDGKHLAKSIKRCIVLQRTGNEIEMKKGRDVWWHDEVRSVKKERAAESMDSEAPLFILYTSGSTGKPKGILHTTGGYMLGAKLSSRYVFDLKKSDIYWCTADVGWVTGHSYVVYGPLANGATVFMYEGAPNFPEPDRFWSMVERHKVTIFYTAPTAIRTFMKWGKEWPEKHDLSSLRVLGTVGEPINPEAWMWYHEVIGGKKCPIVDTWWQTETGSIMITPLPGATPTKPGSGTLPFFGVVPDIVDDKGEPVSTNVGGKLVIKKPWPSMLRGLWRDPKRYLKAYWKEVPHRYFTGDGCRRDEDGYYWIVGRIDDVMNVAGHRIGTAEVESALDSHPFVAESAVVGRADPISGQALVAFVTLKGDAVAEPKLGEELRKHVAKQIGPIAKPASIRFTESLPKTRSGKIMRRLLKFVATGSEVQGDMTTLEDFSVLAKLSTFDDDLPG